jgi:predicted nucleic acid-binding protein
MQNQNYRVVLDTNQIVAAGSRWIEDGVPTPDSNASRRLLIRVAEAHTGLYCGKIVGEYLEKLVDRRHPPDRALKLMTYIMGAFRQVEIISTAAPTRPSDPDDEVFLLCALDGNADYLIAEDKHLTDLKPNYPRPVIGRCSELAGNFDL